MPIGDVPPTWVYQWTFVPPASVVGAPGGAATGCVAEGAAVRPTVDRMAFNLRHFGAAGAA